MCFTPQMNGKVPFEKRYAVCMIHVGRYILYLSQTVSVYTYTSLKLWHAEWLSAACSPNSAETSAEHRHQHLLSVPRRSQEDVWYDLTCGFDLYESGTGDIEGAMSPDDTWDVWIQVYLLRDSRVRDYRSTANRQKELISSFRVPFPWVSGLYSQIMIWSPQMKCFFLTARCLLFHLLSLLIFLSLVFSRLVCLMCLFFPLVLSPLRLPFIFSSSGEISTQHLVDIHNAYACAREREKELGVCVSSPGTRCLAHVKSGRVSLWEPSGLFLYPCPPWKFSGSPILDTNQEYYPPLLSYHGISTNAGSRELVRPSPLAPFNMWESIILAHSCCRSMKALVS